MLFKHKQYRIKSCCRDWTFSWTRQKNHELTVGPLLAPRLNCLCTIDIGYAACFWTAQNSLDLSYMLKVIRGLEYINARTWRRRTKMAGSLLTYETVRRLHAMQICLYRPWTKTPAIRRTFNHHTCCAVGDLQPSTETGTCFIDLKDKWFSRPWTLRVEPSASGWQVRRCNYTTKLTRL
jgi:hypothetical protein